jgi:hypothetical protein
MTNEPEPKQEDLTEATGEASIELQEADLARVAGGYYKVVPIDQK